MDIKRRQHCPVPDVIQNQQSSEVQTETDKRLKDQNTVTVFTTAPAVDNVLANDNTEEF